MSTPHAPRGSRRPSASTSSLSPTANLDQTSHMDEPTANQAAKQENTPLKPSNDTSQMMTRSGRRLGTPVTTTRPASKSVRNASVARSWQKLNKSASYQELISESLVASCPIEIAKVETKIWNGRHGFAQEDSAQKGALKGHLVSYLESREKNVDGNGKKNRNLSDHRESDWPDSREGTTISRPQSPAHDRKLEPSNSAEQSPAPQSPLCQNNCQECQLPCTRKLAIPNDLLDQSNELPEQHRLSTQYDYSYELEPGCIENGVDSVPPDSSGRRVSLVTVLPIRQLNLQLEKSSETPSDLPDVHTSSLGSGRLKTSLLDS